ncbi:MAG: glycosyltransferase family 2 protein [bacterium]|nr:glycosyltransferase family 2 protein [bacterium]
MKKHDRFIRFFEILPGALVWGTIIAGVTLSFVRPLWVVYFVIIFDLYWLFRVAYFIPFLLTSWWRFRRDTKIDWQSQVERIDGYDRIHHLIFLPTYKENVDVIRGTLDSLLASAYPESRMMIVLAGEERDAKLFRENVRILKKEYGSRFMKLFVTEHPMNLPDEIPGKGSNLHFSGREIVREIDRLGLLYDNIVVSSFDVDTIVHPQYFSRLTQLYLTTPEPTRSSYQPIALYNNNLWDSPAAVRVAMFGTTFWLMSELSRPENAMTFSSHSMSLRMLVDVGYWQKDIVSEDSRIFLQGFIHYHGQYRITPMYLPVSMDSITGETYWGSLSSLYKQLRRWAWGVENFPFMVKAFAEDSKMPRRLKIRFLFKQIEGMYTWATAPLLILILGRLPFWVASDSFREFVIFQNTPFTLQWLMRFALVGVFVSATLALTLLPARPSHVPLRNAFVVGFLQWALLPFTFVIFGAIPAIDAQTRLMLGKYLGFNVSAKRVSAPEGKKI